MSKRGTIRIYTNESVNVAIAEGLRRRGINAISAKDIGNLGLRDEDQLKYALKEKLVIFTHYDDFLRYCTECENPMIWDERQGWRLAREDEYFDLSLDKIFF